MPALKTRGMLSLSAKVKAYEVDKIQAPHGSVPSAVYARILDLILWIEFSSNVQKIQVALAESDGRAQVARP